MQTLGSEQASSDEESTGEVPAPAGDAAAPTKPKWKREFSQQIWRWALTCAGIVAIIFVLIPILAPRQTQNLLSNIFMHSSITQPVAAAMIGTRNPALILPTVSPVSSAISPNSFNTLCQNLKTAYDDGEWNEVISEITLIKKEDHENWEQQPCETDQAIGNLGELADVMVPNVFEESRSFYRAGKEQDAINAIQLLINFDDRYRSLANLTSACDQNNFVGLSRIAKNSSNTFTTPYILQYCGDANSTLTTSFTDFLGVLNSVYSNPTTAVALTSPNDNLMHLTMMSYENDGNGVYNFRWNADSKEAILPFSQTKDIFPNNEQWNNIFGMTLEFSPLIEQNFSQKQFFDQGSEVGFEVVGSYTLKFVIAPQQVNSTRIDVVPLISRIDGSIACTTSGNLATPFWDNGSLNTLPVGYEWNSSTKSIQFYFDGRQVCSNLIPFPDMPSDVILYANAAKANTAVLIKNLVLLVSK